MMPICNTIAEAFVLIFFLRTTTDCVAAVKVCNLFFDMCTVQILSCLYDLIYFFFNVCGLKTDCYLNSLATLLP